MCTRRLGFELPEPPQGIDRLLCNQLLLGLARQLFNFGFSLAGTASVVVVLQIAKSLGLAPAEKLGAALAAGVGLPAPFHIGGNAGIQAIIARLYDIHLPVVCIFYTLVHRGILSVNGVRRYD